MNSNVVAICCVCTESDVVDTDEIHNVFEVFHHGLNVVGGVTFGESGVRCCLNTDYPTLFGARPQHIVGSHSIGVPQRPCSDVTQHDGLFASGYRVKCCLVATMRTIDKHPQLVHAPYSSVPKVR